MPPPRWPGSFCTGESRLAGGRIKSRPREGFKAWGARECGLDVAQSRCAAVRIRSKLIQNCSDMVDRPAESRLKASRRIPSKTRDSLRKMLKLNMTQRAVKRDEALRQLDELAHIERPVVQEELFERAGVNRGFDGRFSF